MSFPLFVWMTIYTLLYPLMWLFRRNRDNCLTWALRRQLTDGGYLVMRWSRCSRFKWICWPHFLWLDAHTGERVLEQWVPHPWIPHQKTKSRWFPQYWFHGVWKHGDEPDDDET